MASCRDDCREELAAVIVFLISKYAVDCMKEFSRDGDQSLKAGLIAAEKGFVGRLSCEMDLPA